jgi:transposase
MTKFSHEFRTKVIKARLEGKSFRMLAKEFGIGNTTARTWVQKYNAGGTKQLLLVNRHYTPEFKKKVIEYRWEHGLSLMQTVAQFQIPNIGTVYQWERRLP